jgi:hypothetical protein
MGAEAVNLSLDTEGGWYTPAIRINPGASGGHPGLKGWALRFYRVLPAARLILDGRVEVVVSMRRLLVRLAVECEQLYHPV